jgi:hypothetical protein
MTNNALGYLTPPDLAALLRSWSLDVFARFNCHQIGTIESFDPATQTATVQMAIQRAVYNQAPKVTGGLQTTPQILTAPLLVKCPVYVATGGDSRLTLPIASGDTCLVLFNDRDIDTWFASGNIAPPTTRRMHSLSDGLVLVGFRHSANPVPNYSTTAAELITGQSKVSVSAGGAKVELDNKVKISNGTGDLKTALDTLVTALTSWVDTRGDSPNPATIAALNNAKTAIGQVLKS